MIQIRRNVFETNSSSTHSLAIPQDFNLYNIKKKKLNFRLGSYMAPSNPIKVKPTDYLYTAIMDELNYIACADGISERRSRRMTRSKRLPNWEKYCPRIKERLLRLKWILSKYNIVGDFEEPVWTADVSSPKSTSYCFYREEKYWKKRKARGYEFIDNNFGIDHADEVQPLVDMLLANPEECMKFLLGGKVFVGSDGCDDLQAAQIYWKDKTYERHFYVDKNGKEVKMNSKNYNEVEVKSEELPNPYYMEGYNFYLKGNEGI